MKTDDFLNQIDIPAGLESSLEALIDRLDKEEMQSKRKTKQIRLWAGSITASLAILISAGLYFYPSGKIKNPDVSQTATLTDAEKTYRETEKALALVSIHFNKGISQLAILSGEIEKANKTLDKTFKNLQK